MNLIAVLEPFRNCPRWLIAYSGGVDSHVLLHRLAQWRHAEKNLPALTAIHINHQLNPRASAWAEHCRAVCTQLGIDFVVETVDVTNIANDGIEAAARAARYAAFERHVQANELLLQAHHRDDQVETLLLRLLRGSGIAGLGAIPESRALGRGHLLRPLLNTSRAEILAYANQHGLHWVEDDSNHNAAFDRNFLRLRVLPVIAERWPAYRVPLARVAEQARAAQTLLDEVAAQDLTRATAADRGISIPVCADMSPERRLNLLRHWLRQRNLPTPTREQLLQVERMLFARIDAQPWVQWAGAEVHRFREHLYAMPPQPPAPQSIDEAWNPEREFTAPGLGSLRAQSITGQGLRADREYRIRNRRGGERCKPAGRAHSQTLKKLLQEYAVPPWLRDRLPLIYCGDQLAAVADLWICEGYVAAGDQFGLQLEWLPTDEPGSNNI